MSKFVIPRAADKLIIDCINEAPSVGGPNEVINISPFAQADVTGLELGDFKENETIKEIYNTESFLIDRFIFSKGRFRIQYYRGGQAEPKSLYQDELSILESGNGATFGFKEKAKLMRHFLERLNRFDESQPPTLSKEQAEQAAIHSSILTRLESTNTYLLEEGQAYKRSVDNDFKQREQSLREELEQSRAETEDKFQKKHEDLEEQKNKLGKLKEELDDKNNTHARRQIRKDIIGEIKSRQEKFSLTDGTNSMRIPTMIAMGVLTVFLAAFTVSSALDLPAIMAANDFNGYIIAVAKQVIYSIGTVGSIIFFIRWQNRWSEHHSSAEFQLKQFELDMERASWLVETSLEWKDAKGTSIPPELLNSLSKNLFAHKDADFDPLVHPADQLASALFGSASAIKLQAGNASLDIDPKKLSKAKAPVKTTEGDK